jgi:hypothetical protein
VHQIDARPKGERDAHKLLYAGFMAAPIIAGIDKFTDKLGNWDKYLSDDVAGKTSGATAHVHAGCRIDRDRCGNAGRPQNPSGVVTWLARGWPASWPISGRSRSIGTSLYGTSVLRWAPSRWHEWPLTSRGIVMWRSCRRRPCCNRVATTISRKFWRAEVAFTRSRHVRFRFCD